MNIHTIGDSHSYSGWQDIILQNGKKIIIHHIDSILCYSFGMEKLKRVDIRNYNINNGDAVIFCFGEIDCRCHVHKHINENVTYKDVINNIINNYIDAIKLNIKTSGLNIKICVYNVVPPVKKTAENENRFPVPFLGSDEERKKYVLYFNKLLKEECEKNNYLFFDIYNYYTDENGFINPEMSNDVTHIKNSIYLENFINENILYI